MKIFLDCEFTGLHQQTSLISLGMVSEDNRYCYLEFPVYNDHQVNSWIYHNVIQKLRWDRHPKVQGVYPLHAILLDGTKRTPQQVLDTSTGEILPHHLEGQYYDEENKAQGALLIWLLQFAEERSVETDAGHVVEIWGDVLPWDWILFCELLGGVELLPDHISYIPMDIGTYFRIAGIDPDIDREAFAAEGGHLEQFVNSIPNAASWFGHKHTALYDALIIRLCYERLQAECQVKTER